MTTGTGTLAVTDYRYGDGAERLASLAALPTGGTARTWYGADPQGSVRYTTDDGANVSPTVNYDPYGQPEGGAVPPTFGYNGEVQDAATGLVNLRARTYNPATGQFLTRDPLQQQTGQAYLYAGGDPINGSDPSGDCTVRGDRLPGVGASGTCTQRDIAGVISDILHGRGMPVANGGRQSPAEEICLREQLLRRGGGGLNTFLYSTALQLPGGARLGLGIGAEGGIDLTALAALADALAAGAAVVGEAAAAEAAAVTPVGLGALAVGGLLYLGLRYLTDHPGTAVAPPPPGIIRCDTSCPAATIPLAQTTATISSS